MRALVARRNPAQLSTADLNLAVWIHTMTAGGRELAVNYCELEVSLSRTNDEGYGVELRYTNPASDAEIAPVRGTASIDLEALRALHLEPRAYGEALSAGLFADATIARFYARVTAASEAAALQMRLRIAVTPAVSNLQSVRWELLTDPETRQPLATSERILISRFILSHDLRSIKLRARSALRALVAVSSPNNLADYNLAAIDSDGEIERARSSFAGIPMTVVGRDEPLTLDALVNAMRRGYDIVYLVAHGVVHKRKGPHLWLQDGDGAALATPADRLSGSLSELVELPRLMVLASCESAGAEAASTSGSSDGVAALAPSLAQVGVPAILAMQGKISMTTVEKSMPIFFSELLQDGQIDRALAVARRAVRDQPDSWMPALYLRLRGGRIWFEPGFGSGKDFGKWATIIDSIRNRKLTPILGPETAVRVCGGSRDIARRLAELVGYPFAARDGLDLGRVASFLRINQDLNYMRSAFKQARAQEIRHRQPDALTAMPATASLGKLIKAVAEHLWRDDSITDLHEVVARLPCPIYINVNQDDLLTLALQRVGKEPQVEICRWREKAGSEQPPRPTVEKPLVFHIMGHFKDDDSLVLTDDDYIDYLIRIHQDRRLIPSVVEAATADRSLAFLGFDLDSPSFRILFRKIMSQEGRARLRNLTHVAVQIDPEDDRITNSDKARSFLSEYFREESAMDIFWGGTEDFARALSSQLEGVTLDPPDDDDDEDEY